MGKSKKKKKLLLLKLKVDSENAQIKKQMGDLQQYIACLGLSQRRLFQELRRRLKLRKQNNLSSPVKEEDSDSKDTHLTVNGSTEDSFFVRSSLSSIKTYPGKTAASSSDEASLKPPDSIPSSPRKRARIDYLKGSSPPPRSTRSKSSTPEKDEPLKSSPATPSTTRSISSFKNFVRSSPSTRSSRTLTSPCPSPIPSPEPIENENTLDNFADVDAALDIDGSEEERKLKFLLCVDVLTFELRNTISEQRELRRLKPGMDPFIMLCHDQSQKRRRDTYLLNVHSAPKSYQHQEESDHDFVSASEDSPMESDAGGSGEQDQLFTEHQLDQLQLADQHVFYGFTDFDKDCRTSEKTTAIVEREQKNECSGRLLSESNMLEKKNEVVSQVIQSPFQKTSGAALLFKKV